MRSKARNHCYDRNVFSDFKSAAFLQRFFICGFARKTFYRIICGNFRIGLRIVIIYINAVDNATGLESVHIQNGRQPLRIIIGHYLFGIARAYRRYFIGAHDSTLGQVYIPAEFDYLFIRFRKFKHVAENVETVSALIADIVNGINGAGIRKCPVIIIFPFQIDDSQRALPIV